MHDLFAAIVPWATLVFAVSSMLNVGLAHSARSILGPLRRLPRVFRSLVSNFVFAPFLAFLVLNIFALEPAHATGLFIVGSAAGAPFLVKLTRVARADMAFAGSLLVLLLPATVVFLSIVVPLVFPGVEVSAAAIALPLILSLVLPLFVGLLIHRYAPRLAARAHSHLSEISTIALVVLVASVILSNLQAIMGIGLRPLLAAICFTLGAFILGWLFGSRRPGTREVVALGTAQRNIAAATVVATQSFEGMRGVLIMVTANSVIGLLVLFPLAFALRRFPAPARFGRRRHV